MRGPGRRAVRIGRRRPGRLGVAGDRAGREPRAEDAAEECLHRLAVRFEHGVGRPRRLGRRSRDWLRRAGGRRRRRRRMLQLGDLLREARLARVPALEMAIHRERLGRVTLLRQQLGHRLGDEEVGLHPARRLGHRRGPRCRRLLAAAARTRRPPGSCGPGLAGAAAVRCGAGCSASIGGTSASSGERSVAGIGGGGGSGSPKPRLVSSSSDALATWNSLPPLLCRTMSSAVSTRNSSETSSDRVRPSRGRRAGRRSAPRCPRAVQPAPRGSPAPRARSLRAAAPTRRTGPAPRARAARPHRRSRCRIGTPSPASRRAGLRQRRRAHGGRPASARGHRCSAASAASAQPACRRGRGIGRGRGGGLRLPARGLHAPQLVPGLVVAPVDRDQTSSQRSASSKRSRRSLMSASDLSAMTFSSSSRARGQTPPRRPGGRPGPGGSGRARCWRGCSRGGASGRAGAARAPGRRPRSCGALPPAARKSVPAGFRRTGALVFRFRWCHRVRVPRSEVPWGKSDRCGCGEFRESSGRPPACQLLSNGALRFCVDRLKLMALFDPPGREFRFRLCKPSATRPNP